MAIRPILFNGEMVRAILDGRKTCTRRSVKGNIPNDAIWGYTGFTPKGYISCRGVYSDGYGEGFYKLPYLPGDVLYVRETWERFECWNCEGDERGNCPKEPLKSVLIKACGCYMYRATDEISGDAKWHPSIHMPKEAARIWLKVTDVRVKRLQGITDEQAKREGIQYDECPTGFTWKQETDMHNCYTTPIGAMQALWNSTIKKSDLDRYGWVANPWVWVIEFERCEKPKE